MITTIIEKVKQHIIQHQNYDKLKTEMSFIELQHFFEYLNDTQIFVKYPFEDIRYYCIDEHLFATKNGSLYEPDQNIDQNAIFRHLEIEKKRSHLINGLKSMLDSGILEHRIREFDEFKALERDINMFNKKSVPLEYQGYFIRDTDIDLSYCFETTEQLYLRLNKYFGITVLR